MSHETLVFLAKSLAPIVLMIAFLVVIFLAYRPGKRAEYERVARSILPDEQGGDRK